MTDPVLFLIPARAGSRRVPGKNLRTVAGIPLVGHAVRIARHAAALVPDGPHAVVCSTDDARIAAVAEAWHADPSIARPPELADDRASSVDVAVHALETLEKAGRRFRRVVLVQPTSPLTDPGDVARAVARADETGTGAVSVVRSHPVGWHHLRGADDRLLPVGDSAEPGTASAPSWLLTGAFYVTTPEDLRAGRRFVEPGRTLGLEVAPARSVDVDEELDLAIAAAIASARPIRPVPLGPHRIGAGPAFIIAEAGINHDGDVTIAHAIVDAAADAGADAVKFQTFDPARLATAAAPTAAYQRASGEDGSQRAMLERYALPVDAWPALQAHATERGLIFLSSPFDEGSADLLDRLDVPAFKVPSGELTNIPFLRHLAAKGRPLLVSTGMADMLEVADALDAIAAVADLPVALFHCVSSYPADPADADLASMAVLRSAFGVPVGWSDHTLGIELATAAAAMGAQLFEKHLTLDRARPGPDHRASIEPEAFGRLVAAVRMVEAARGEGLKHPSADELATAAVARKSLHWSRPLDAGGTVRPGDLVALRPGTGVPPGRLDSIVGRRLARPVRAGAPLELDDLEAGS